MVLPRGANKYVEIVSGVTSLFVTCTVLVLTKPEVINCLQIALDFTEMRFSKYFVIFYLPGENNMFKS